MGMKHRHELEESFLAPGPEMARELGLLWEKLNELEGREQYQRIEEELRRNSAMHWFFNYVNDYITAIGPDYRIISYNRAVEKQFGKNIYGRPCHEAFQNRDAVCPGCAVEKSLGSGKPEFTFQPATEVSRPLEIWAYPIFGEDGEIIAVIEHGRDVTEKMEMIAKIEENDRFLKALIDGVSEPIMVIGVNYTINLMNKAAYEKIPIRQRGKKPLKCHEVSHRRQTPCSSDEHACPLELVRKSLKTEVVEHVHFRADGTCEHIEISASPLLGDNGELLGIIEANRDITKRKKHEIALKEAEEKYSALWDSNMVGIAVADEKGKYILANKAMLDMTGYGEQELIGRKFSEISHPDDFDENNYNFSKLVAGRKTNYRLRKRYLHRDGHTVWCDLSVFGIYDSKSNFQYCYGIHRDITNEVLAEENLKWELKVNKTLGEMGSAILEKQVKVGELAKLIHSFSIEITGSEHGFVAVMDPEDGSMIGYTLSEMMDQGCRLEGEDRRIRFPRGPEGRYPGLCGHALNAREGFYTNTPEEHPAAKGPPEGHVGIDCFLAAPSAIGGEMLGMIAVANKPGGYSDRDLEAVKRLSEIYALAILRTRSEERLQASLKEKNVLLKEIHHRVKNNMQIISSLLHLQESSVKDPAYASLLEESQNRIRSMALVHEKLYQTEDLSSISLKSYVNSLANHLLNTYYRSETAIKPQIWVEDIDILIDDLIPLGLILNELISNSLKHAFRGRDSGSISVLISEDPRNTINVSVEDDGRGLPDDFEFYGGGTVGIKLINTLAKQLGANIEISEEGGFRVSLSFKRTD
jgi:PAS domain S-box-containing protein